jgi:ribosomal RNA-processing protein 36
LKKHSPNTRPIDLPEILKKISFPILKMSSVKRKVPASLLQRRVKPRYEPEPELDIEDDLSDAPSEEGAGFSGSGDEEDEELDGDETGSGSDEVRTAYSRSKTE